VESDIPYAPLNRLIRTASFRLAALYVVVFALSVIVLGAVVYFSVGREISAAVDERVREDSEKLQVVYRANGLDKLVQLVSARVLEAGSLDYRLEDASGRLLAGNLPSPRTPGHEYSDGWTQLGEPSTGSASESRPEWERALVTTLDDGAVLVVGNELNEIRLARRAILIAFAWSVAATLALGVLGGFLVSAAFLRRIDAMTTAARAIIGGNLSRRIETSGVDDDLGRLAKTFNQMLDQIETLLEANKQVSNDIAHDLRSPLARVLRRMEAAKEYSANSAEHSNALDASIEDIHHILEIFNALLRIGQIEAGARRAGFRSVDLAAVARKVAEAFQPAAADEDKTLVIELPQPLPMLGDEELLTQLVANLVDNAVRHTSAGSRIEVSAAVGPAGRRFSVADDGPGVPSAELERIFERFHRVDSARATPGDGLGLSLVAAIAGLHGAEIRAERRQPGLAVILTLAEAPAPSQTHLKG
jgi:signal transduction histidine kinase